MRDHRVVFLALARPEFLERRPTWGAGMIGNTTLPLEALTPAETAEVVGALLGSADADAVERVVATAGGNPLFIEELVAALEDDPDADELPATVRTAIAARIDALSPTARATLLNASVIGATFWRNVVQGIGEVEDIAEALKALEDRGLVHRRAESQVEGDTEYAFKHILIRDTAYGTLPRARRRELHAATARFIEGATSGSSELAWLLAHHWREAGEPQRAIGYLLAAAARARDALALEETFDLFTRALEMGRDRRGSPGGSGSSEPWRWSSSRTTPAPAVSWPSCSRNSTAGTRSRLCSARGHSALWTEQTEETIEIGARAVELVASARAPRARGSGARPAVAGLRDARRRG